MVKKKTILIPDDEPAQAAQAAQEPPAPKAKAKKPRAVKTVKAIPSTVLDEVKDEQKEVIQAEPSNLARTYRAADLKEIAKQNNVRGFSRMTKGALYDVLRNRELVN